MMQDRPEFDDGSAVWAVAGAVFGDGIEDWDVATEKLPPEQLPFVRELKLIAEVIAAHEERQRLPHQLGEKSSANGGEPQGQTWGPLVILEKIGEGAFGQVYKAREPRLDRQVALKLFRPERMTFLQVTSDVIEEGRLLARVHHPNVVTVHGAEHLDGKYGIWMEFVEGSTLEQIVTEQGPLSATEAMKIGRDLCRALTALHTAGILHRDIKARNVMRDDSGRVVLMDLGISSEIDRQIPVRQYGTPLFAAPEVLLANISTRQSDLYSVGVLLFLLVTGEYPVSGSTLAEIRKNHEIGEHKVIRDLRSDLPEALLQIIDMALAPEPDDRFASALEFEDALSTALDDESEVRRRQDQATKKTVTGKRLLGIAGTVLSLAAVLLVGYMTLFPNQDREPGLPGEVQRVLVTYLDNRTGDASLDPIGPMTADWISHGLTQTEVVKVVPTMTVLQAMGAVAAAGGELTDMERLNVLAESSAATIILSGAYYLVSDSLRFHLQATDMQSEALLFSLAPVIGSSENPIETIVQARAMVLGAMVTHLNPARDVDFLSQQDMLHKPPTYQAYSQYMAGIGKFGVDYGQSFDYFSRAVELDSTFVMPLFWIAGMYINLGQLATADSLVQLCDLKRDSITPFERHILDAFKADLRGPRSEELRQYKLAESYSPNDVTVNYLVGLVELHMNNPRGTVETYQKLEPPAYFLEGFGGVLRFWALARAFHHLGDYEKELATVNRALEYHPRAINHLGEKVRALAALGRIQEINLVIEECLTAPVGTRNPSDVMCAAAKELRMQGRFDMAREFASRAVDWCNQQPDPAAHRGDLADALRLAERWTEAQVVFAELAAENPDKVANLGKLGTLAVRLGDEGRAREIFNSLRQMDPLFLRGEHMYWCACISALLGERELAVVMLKEAWDQGMLFPDIKWRDMDLEPLGDFPHFQEMIKPKGL